PTPPTVDTLSPMASGQVAVCGGACGVERWAVKTLSDLDRDRVKLQPVDATIEGLVGARGWLGIPRPGGGVRSGTWRNLVTSTTSSAVTLRRSFRLQFALDQLESGET